MSKLIPMACLALLGTAGYAWAEQTAETPPRIQQVNVSGARAGDTEARRLSTAAKMVFGREGLERNGDTSVSEVLKRLPGVTIGGAPGRGGGGVRMRGMLDRRHQAPVRRLRSVEAEHRVAAAPVGQPPRSARVRNRAQYRHRPAGAERRDNVTYI